MPGAAILCRRRFSAAPPAPGPTILAPSPPLAEGPAAASAVVRRVRRVIRQRHHSLRTEKSYAGWVRRFLVFQRHHDLARLGAAEVRAHLPDLAVRRRVSASTQNQAFSALFFLFREVLGRKLEHLEDTPRAKTPARLPLILARREVLAILGRLRGRLWLIASLMYGGRLRLEECLGLRIKDVDFERRVLVVRDGKGRKDRETVFPRKLMEPLRQQLDQMRVGHERDLADGRGAVGKGVTAQIVDNDTVRIVGEALLFEGTTESSPDLDGRKDFTLLVPRGKTVANAQEVRNTDEGGDYAKIRMTFNNALLEE